MKNLLCLCLALFAFQFTMAQAKEDAAVKPDYYDKPLPSFSLQLVDSNKNYTNEDLPKNKQVILIWFNPDCEHCQAETKLIREHIDAFADAHIVMATYQPFEKMKTFYDTYEIKKYPAISMGRDTKYFFGNYFKVHFVPFIAIYDKNYKLKKVFEGGATMEQMAEALK